MYDVVENFQIQNFGNPNGRKYCQDHCGHADRLFNYVYGIDFEIRASKIALQCDVAEVSEAISQEPLTSQV